MSAAERDRALANDLARRAIEAAERRQAEAGISDDMMDRLQRAAGPDGRLTVSDAIQALADQSSNGDWLRDAVAQQRQHRSPEPEQPEPPTRPQASANGGQGEGEDAQYEWTEGGLMRVWSPEELTLNNDKEMK